MNVHCPFCRNSFNLARDYLAHAVAEADEKRQKYHTVECASCRKSIKIATKQMRRYLPKEKPAESE